MIPTQTRPALARAYGSRSYFTKRTYTASQVKNMALTAIATVALVSAALLLRGYYLSSPPAAPRTHHYAPPQSPRANMYPRTRAAAPPRTPFQFAAPADELGALVGFMADVASNALPTTIDPGAPLDPDLVLGFNPRDPALRDEVRAAVRDAWRTNPVVVLSELKTGNPPASREMKGVIQALNLYPDPTIIDVDQRTDSDVTMPLLKRLTGAEQLPVVIIGGQPVRSMKEFRTLVESGSLKELVTASGAKINGKKVKHGRKH